MLLATIKRKMLWKVQGNFGASKATTSKSSLKINLGCLKNTLHFFSFNSHFNIRTHNKEAVRFSHCFIQSCKECRSPVHIASFDTQAAKLGLLFIPQSMFEVSLELRFQSIQKRNGLKRDFSKNFKDNRPYFATNVL